MTQADKDLLSKDLCARLPYGVKILIQDTFKYSIVPLERHVLDVSNFSDIFCFKYKKIDKRMKKAMRERPDSIVIKPYLFPLSSMTEEQRQEVKDLGWNFDNFEIHNVNECIGTYREYVAHSDCSAIIDLLNKNHFDYRGLIPMGLAIDATRLNIY